MVMMVKTGSVENLAAQCRKVNEQMGVTAKQMQIAFERMQLEINEASKKFGRRPIQK